MHLSFHWPWNGDGISLELLLHGKHLFRGETDTGRSRDGRRTGITELLDPALPEADSCIFSVF